MMFEGFSQETLDFMWGIRFNNERGWFEAHKQDYLNHLYHPMKALCHQVCEELSDECAQRAINGRVCRIYRDARRLHGHGPYKDHLWFALEHPTENFAAHPTFWFELEPEGWSYGLGYYAAKAVTMAKLRTRLDHDPQPVLRLLREIDKQGEFLLEGPAYKKEKAAPHPELTQLYNKKSFSFIHEEDLTEEIYSPQLAQRISEGLRPLFPMYDYLSTLDSDPAPEGY